MASCGYCKTWILFDSREHIYTFKCKRKEQGFVKMQRRTEPHDTTPISIILVWVYNDKDTGMVSCFVCFCVLTNPCSFVFGASSHPYNYISPSFWRNDFSTIFCGSRYTPFVVASCASEVHRASEPGRGKSVLICILACSLAFHAITFDGRNDKPSTITLACAPRVTKLQ